MPTLPITPTIAEAERSFAAHAETATKGSGFVADYRTLSLSQARRVLVIGILALVVGFAVVVSGLYFDPDQRPVRAYIAMVLGVLLGTSSVWPLIRCLTIRREVSDFLNRLLDSSPATTAVRELRIRARRLRRNAQVSLALIVAALATGLMFFVYAGSIASFDRESQIRYEIEIDRQRLELQKQLQSDQDEKTLPGFLNIDQRLRRLEESMAQENAANSPAVKSVEDKQFTQQMVTTTTTRIGSIVILLFLVQILVTLYRYNVRAAAFYDGRADALLMARQDDSSLGALVDLFTPSTLDFGKMPATPLSSVLETAKDAFKSVSPVQRLG